MKDITAVHFKAGDVIFREGDRPGGVYLINQGAVEITKDKAGEKITLATLGWNSIFGEMALIDKKPRSATATALKDTWCYLVDEQSFQKKIDELDPFMRGICRVLVQIARNMTEKYPAEMEEVVSSVPPQIAMDESSPVDAQGRPMKRSTLPMVDDEKK